MTTTVERIVLESIPGPSKSVTEQEAIRRILSHCPQDQRTKTAAIIDAVLLNMISSGLLEFDRGGGICKTSAGRERITLIQRRQREEKNIAKEARIRRKAIRNLKKEARIQSRHEETKIAVATLGQALGFDWSLEVPLDPQRTVILDAIWTSKPEGSWTYAFEVHHHGDWKNAIGNLEATRRYYPDCHLFLVATEDRDLLKINALLNARRESSIRIVRADRLSSVLFTLQQAHEQVAQLGISVAPCQGRGSSH